MADSYRTLLITAVGVGAALLLHVYAGWRWSIGAGILVGALVGDRGWWYGGLAVCGDWCVLVIWNVIEAAGPTLRLADAMGSLIGNVPGWVFLVLTAAVGFGIGASGGLIGRQIRLLFAGRRETTADQERAGVATRNP